MARPGEWMIQGRQETLFVREWQNRGATWLALIAHGYGEHIGRYTHVADALGAAGAAVVGPDHQGHGRTGGERVVIEDFETVTEDLHRVAQAASEKYPDLPVVLIGHSMGGMIAARYGQQFGRELSALVLSGPALGGQETLKLLLSMDPIPEIPLDPAVLSRDPAVGQAYADDPLVWHGTFKRPTLKAMAAAMDAIAQGPSLDNLPTLWIHGEADQLVPLADTRPVMERLRGSAFEEIIYPGAMHEVFNEINREQVIEDVVGFIRRSLKPR